jgi:predicted dienelactone hydrolase
VVAACGTTAVPGAATARGTATPGDGTPGALPSPAAHATAGPSAAQQPRRPAGVIGSYRVAKRTIRLTEAAHDGPDGHVGPRRLAVTVRYPLARPAVTGGFPLVVFAPGFLQCGSAYAGLLRAWASAGYVVAVTNFPRTSCHAGTVADEADLVNQPADVSFIIGRLLTLGARPRHWLSGLVNQAEVAVAGHSDGGDAAAAVAAGSCCADSRVGAAIILAGAEWPPLGERYFSRQAPPVLFVQGSADTINPPEASQQLYLADSSRRRFYLDMLGAGHLSPYEGHGRQERVVAEVTTDFLDRYLTGRRLGAAMRRAGDVPGVSILYSDGRLPP